MRLNVEPFAANLVVRQMKSKSADASRRKAVWDVHHNRRGRASIHRMVVAWAMLIVLLAAPVVHAADTKSGGWVGISESVTEATPVPVAESSPALAPTSLKTVPVQSSSWTASTGCEGGCSDLLKRARRPMALPAMYLGLGALQGLDLYSTSRALRHGGYEANPVMARVVGNRGASIALKAGTSAAMIFFAERLRKKSPVAAITMMAIVNGFTGLVVAHNFRNARTLAARR